MFIALMLPIVSECLFCHELFAYCSMEIKAIITVLLRFIFPRVCITRISVPIELNSAQANFISISSHEYDCAYRLRASNEQLIVNV